MFSKYQIQRQNDYPKTYNSDNQPKKKEKNILNEHIPYKRYEVFICFG
jgi:hypothetical protein